MGNSVFDPKESIEKTRYFMRGLPNRKWECMIASRINF